MADREKLDRAILIASACRCNSYFIAADQVLMTSLETESLDLLILRLAAFFKEWPSAYKEFRKLVTMPEK